MSSIFEYKLVPYKENDYSYISKKNKKDFTSFELFRILVIAIATKFFIVDKPARIYGTTYKIRSPLPDEKEWNAYLQKIPVFYIKDILLKIVFKDIINFANVLNINPTTGKTCISQKIDQNLFNSLVSHIPSILLTGINYCIITNEKFYSEIFLKNLKNAEISIKGKIKTKNLGPGTPPTGKNIKNFEVNKHKNHITTTNIIPLIYLIYSYIYIKYYKNIKCKKIFVESKLDYELYNNVFSHRNPVIKKVNVYLNDILKDENNNIVNKKNNGSQNNNKNNSKKNIIENIKNGVIKDKLVELLDFIDTKIDVYDASEKNIKIIKNMSKLLDICIKNIDFIINKINNTPTIKSIIQSIDNTSNIKEKLESISPNSQVSDVFGTYKAEYKILLNYYIDIIKNINEINKNLLNYKPLQKEYTVLNIKYEFDKIIENIYNENFSKDNIDYLKKFLEEDLKKCNTNKDNNKKIKDNNNNIKNNLKNEKEIIENIFNKNYSNKNELINEDIEKKKEIYNNIEEILNTIASTPDGTSSNGISTNGTSTNGTSHSDTTPKTIFNCSPTGTHSGLSGSNDIGKSLVENIIKYNKSPINGISIDAKIKFNELLLYIYQSLTLYEYFESIYLIKFNNPDEKIDDIPNIIDSFKLDFEKYFRDFKNNDIKKYEDQIKLLESKKEEYESLKENAEYELAKYGKNSINNKINEFTKNESLLFDKGKEIKKLIDEINKDKETDDEKIVKNWKKKVIDILSKYDKSKFEKDLQSSINEKKTNSKKSGGAEFLINILNNELSILNFSNLNKKKTVIEKQKKNKKTSLETKDINKPLAQENLNNINNIISFIDKELQNVKNIKNSNSSNKNDTKTKFIEIFNELLKYSNEIDIIKNKINYNIVINKILHYYESDTRLNLINNYMDDDDVIKSMNNYYVVNNDKDKFTFFIYNIVIKDKKFPNDDVKIFFDKYKDFCENLSTTITKLLNHIDKNNIKKFSYNDDIFDELIQEKNKKICTILDKANNNINSKNGKYIRILAYTDIFHVYIMIFLIFIDYLNYYYFCELDNRTRTP
jgi:hypothetical protein